MISRFFEYILVGTSVSPVFITFYVVGFLETNSYTKGVYWLILFLISLLAFYLIKRFAEKKLERMPIEITHVSPADKEVATFLLAYVLPFLNIGSSNIFVQIAIVVMLYMIVLTSSNYHFNPVLSLFGFHYYEITLELNIDDRKYSYSYILMTRKTIRDCRNIKKVIPLSDYMVMEVET